MQLLSIQQVCEITSLERTTIKRWEKRGEFPRRRKLGNRRVAWDAEEVQAWIESLPIADQSTPNGGNHV